MAATSELIQKAVPDGVYKKLIEHFGSVDLENGGWISGGSVRKIWYDLPWMEQDIDYFFDSPTAFDSFSKKIQVMYDHPQDISVAENPWSSLATKQTPYMSCYSTNNANTYTFEQFDLSMDDSGNQSAILEMRIKIQAIKKYFPATLEDLFTSFDFTVCQFATDGKTMVATRSAVEDCESGRLAMVPNTVRKMNLVRVAKYCAYGFSPSDELMEMVLKAISNDEPMVIDDDY